MPQGLQDFFKQLSSFWGSLSNAKRLALVTLTSAVLVGALLFPVLVGQPKMVPLYSGMETEDASAVVQKLESLKIPYELRADGTTILVPEEQLYKLRLDMASAGLPKGGSIGFELFDQNQFGATEFEQQVSLRRALEGELSRSINTVDGVASSRVHLVMPKSSVFLSKKEQASASVVVKLKNPALFGKKEVAAVVHLVAAAVPGLSRNHISVVSTEGVTLHRPSLDESGGLGTEMLAEESQAVAQRLEAQAIAQLERVVGPGGADVRVAVVLDASTKEQTKETYQPDKTALRSEQQSEEEVRSQSPGAEGIPGARSNLPGNDGNEATQATAGQNLDTTSRKSHTRNWEVDRAVEKVHTPPGQVGRLSVAVLLNGSWQKQKAGPDVFVPRAQAEVDQLTLVVRQAVGFDEMRGDTISVSAAKFARGEQLDELSGGGENVAWWKRPWVLLAAAALLAVAILAVVVLVWRGGRQKKLAEAVAQARLEELRQARAEIGLHPTDETNDPQLVGTLDPKKLLTGGPEVIAELRQKALEIAAKDPSTTAVVLRAFLEQGNELESNAAA